MKKYITKQSGIKGAGKGLFTNAPFKKGEVIGLAHVDDQPASEIGRNHNHNEENPTANNIKDGNKRYLIASRNLKPGEEITTNYRLQPELEQPEDFMRKGGSLLKMPNKKNSKGYSRSLSATNKLFTQNFLFAKPKSRKNKVFDPNSKYYAEGGEYEDAELTPEEIEEYRANGYIVDDTIYQDGGDTDGMTGMMKARLAYANEFGNPAAERMINIPDNPYQFDNGDTGTHYMASMDNYAVPQIQDENGVLQLGDYGPESNEAIRFDSDEDANYFAENYKDVSPGFIEAELDEDEIQAYKDGGYIVEDISIPSLNKRKFAPGGVTDLNPITMAKYLADLKVQENNEKKGFKNNKWYPHRSVEGGADTIGYGHKLTKADSKLYKGATTEEVEKLLQADVLIKQSEAKKRVDKKYGAGAFDALPQDSQMLVVDYQYNVGLQEFPKFLDALVKGDKDTMLNEYERTTSSGKLTKRNNWAKSVIDNLNYNSEPELIQPNIPLANVADAAKVVPQVIPEAIKEIKYQDGGDVISQYGWDYKTDGDQYLTKRTGTENWIPAKGSSLDAIKQKVYNKPIEDIVPTEETTISEVPVEVKKDSLPVDASVIEIQQKLKKAGYNLGKFGPNKDGVDGQMGNITKVALDAFNAGISPDKVKIPDPKKKIKGQEVNYTVNADLKDGYLPYLDTKQEICIKGKGCSTNVSAKIGNLLGNLTEESLWANDAWYNKDAVIKQGGDLVYESPSRIYNQMGKVPKEVWSKLQVGDYVQLNRPDTKSSFEFSAKGPSKEGYINEDIEHLGFIVGKDKDGTPLIWHGSETGKAFIKRIDEPISLDDHDKNIFTYQVSSIVRSPALKNADLSGLQNSAYYTPLDKSKKLVAKKGATPLQVEATDLFNKSVGQFKNLGYSQDDANYIGGLLIGGIMEQETEGGTSRRAGPKEVAANLIKNVAGVDAFNIPGTDNELYKFATQFAGFSGKPARFPGKEFEGDEASVGQYQLKPNLNFRESNGSLNALGKKLERLGISVEDIDSGNIDAQTKAGTLLLLDAYTSLKKDPDFNIKTGLYKNKIPASYIIAKSWQAGKGWYKRDKYKKYLNDFDITYSNKAIKSTLNNIDFINSDKNLYKEYDTIKKGGALARQEELIRLNKEQIKKDTALSEYKKRNVYASESTGVNKSYKEPVKSFNAYDYFSKNNMQTTVYKYSGRPSAKYKKDKNGNWYVNDGKSTNNKYIALNDPDGKRSRVLNKSAEPLIAKTKPSIAKAKEGGIVTSLSQDEINQYIRNGYVVEELD
jgi:GH24 family phage-related lysozyme (muramidase)